MEINIKMAALEIDFFKSLFFFIIVISLLFFLLIHKLVNHLEQLFVQTINQHQGILHKVCRIYCNNETEREDLFQEMILQLWKSFPSFRKESKVSTWMYRIALNTAISGLRKKRVLTTELDAITYQIKDEKDENLAENLQLLYKAINHLTSIEKSIILLYLEDKPYDEIAEITGITANYVAVKMNRIKEKLKTLLNTER
jgi:RNA polymerase sigma factor (sigma-70 family)